MDLLSATGARDDDVEIYAYPPEAVLKPAQVMAWLQIGPKVFERLPIKFVPLGPHTRRYLTQHVIEYLDGEAHYPE